MSIFNFFSIDRSLSTPAYLQITNAMIYQIQTGRLRKGFKMPGTRHLSDTLGIHRKTLQRALNELLAQGWLEIIPRKGTYVSKNLPKLKPIKSMLKKPAISYPEKMNFSMLKSSWPMFPVSNFQQTKNIIIHDGFPDTRLAPMKDFMRELRSIETRGEYKKFYQYGDPQGSYYLRSILATFLNDTRNLPISAENILITNGAQMGTFLAANLILQKGDQVIVGEPGYVTATSTFQRTGAVINRVPVDDSGINVDIIEALCKRKKIKLVYVIPHHHHPTTVTLTLDRRIQLLNLSAKYRFAIIEDDYDYDFHYNSSPILPMASLDQHGNIIYIGTLSKTLIPSIRIGFVVAPVRFIQAGTVFRRSIDFHGNTILEIALAELYKSKVISNHIKKVVKIYRQRRDLFCELLTASLDGKVSFNIPDGGMNVWTKFHHNNLSKVAAQAAKMGLIMSDGTIYNAMANYNSTRLGFASLNETEMKKTVDILRQAVSKTG
jgi:GntR family transcriptional regulator/MocR family aminotransferase